ncbi:GNAT family N-acetyltransferase [Congregibacter litoralis]|uniref:Acetyltransferase n=1 Tax=Congregibacter litoralis KT71 TaxID=314285 RepID=A4A4M6_9GAMM|nr:Acetyltransferase [Congregibacter litoralis KT71]
MLIRTATLEDANHICNLMAQLGYATSAGLISEKLETFETEALDQVFVAESGGAVCGVVSCHLTSLFHQDGSLGRITSFVVDEEHRNTGIGRSLIEAAEEFFQRAGCIRSEVTSGEHRGDAHAFYKSLGYVEDERRFIKAYS